MDPPDANVVLSRERPLISYEQIYIPSHMYNTHTHTRGYGDHRDQKHPTLLGLADRHARLVVACVAFYFPRDGFPPYRGS